MEYEQQVERAGWQVRIARDDDVEHLQRWLADPATLHCFPVGEPEEVEESAKRWVGLHKEKAALVIECDGEVSGMVVVYLQSEQQLTHQAMHILVVDPAKRRQGIGSFLLQEALWWVKEGLGIELFHVEVTEGTEGVAFYRGHGFEIFARQEGWIKEGDTFYGRILLEKLL